jgi:hypothetical protein
LPLCAWKTFSCRILSAKLTEEEGAIKPFYIDLRDTPTFITEKDIVRQPYLEEIIQSVLRRQEVTTDAQTFIQQAQSGVRYPAHPVVFLTLIEFALN